MTTDSSGNTVTLYSGFAGASATDNAGVSTLMRGWALSAGQTFGVVGVVGSIVGGFAVLL